MTTHHNIDDLVQARKRTSTELHDLGQRIAASAKPITVAFIDLSDSTQMKLTSEPADWLGKVYEFIELVSQLCKTHDGVVVKRIGDEVMVTFPETVDPELFLSALRSHERLTHYSYKVAIDHGLAYHFRFADFQESDPYGTVVDRCARVAKLAKAGTVICTKEYVDKFGKNADYIPATSVYLKGLNGAIDVDLRPDFPPVMGGVPCDFDARNGR